MEKPDPKGYVWNSDLAIKNFVQGIIRENIEKIYNFLFQYSHIEYIYKYSKFHESYIKI